MRNIKIWLKKPQWFLFFILCVLLIFVYKTGVMRCYYRFMYSDVPIFGATDEQEKTIRHTLSVVRKSVIKSVTSFDITYNPPFPYDNFERGDLAYCHADRRIFIKPNFVIPRYILHETTHAYFGDQEFENKWAKVAGQKVYKSKDSKDQRSFPADGILSSYGAECVTEDIAEYGAEIFMYLLEGKNYRGALLLLNTPLCSKDSRYKEKLDLFLEYKAITKEQYDDVVKLLPVLK